MFDRLEEKIEQQKESFTSKLFLILVGAIITLALQAALIQSGVPLESLLTRIGRAIVVLRSGWVGRQRLRASQATADKEGHRRVVEMEPLPWHAGDAGLSMRLP